MYSNSSVITFGEKLRTFAGLPRSQPPGQHLLSHASGTRVRIERDENTLQSAKRGVLFCLIYRTCLIARSRFPPRTRLA